MQQTISEEITITTEEPVLRTRNIRSPGYAQGTRGLTHTSLPPASRRTTQHQRIRNNPEPSAYPCGGGTVNPANLHGYPSRTPPSLDQYGYGVPYMPQQSTPIHSVNFPGQHENFGSPINYNPGLMPQNAEFNERIESSHLQRQLQQGLPSRFAIRDPNLPQEAPRTVPQKSPQQSFEGGDSRFLLKPSLKEELEPSSPKIKSEKRESLLEWFDRTVEKELHRRREGSLNVGENLINLESASNEPGIVSIRKIGGPLILDASSSHVDICANLRSAQNTDLLEAVDKLSKAEAMCAFEGAVRAAEHAAANAPPEYAEEAAVARAQEFEAEVTSIVKQEFSGVKPIEVIGYVGITKPKKPKKSEVLP